VATLVAGIVVVGALVGDLATAAAVGTPTRPVDTDINQYVLFALSSLDLKAGNTIVSQVSGGDMGVNAAGGLLTACGGGGRGASLHMDDGSQAVADIVGMQQNCSVWDLFANTLRGNPPVTLRNSGPNPITSFPIIATSALPTFPDFACAPDNPVIHANGILPPAVYGTVIVDKNATLTLEDGTYTFCSLNVNGAHLHTSAGTIVQIVTRLVVGDGGTIEGACEAHFFIENVSVPGAGSNFGTSTFGRNSSVQGRFWAPNGTLDLGHSTTEQGSFWANRIFDDFNVNVFACDVPIPPTTTTTATATTVPRTTVGPSTSLTTPISPQGSTAPGGAGNAVVANGSGQLPNTGGDDAPGAAGLALVGFGALIAFAARRQRDRRNSRPGACDRR